MKTKHEIIEDISINNNFHQKIGDSESKVIFTVLDGPDLDEYKMISSTLQGSGNHCCVYVADSEWRGIGPDNTGITNQDVKQIIDIFDNTIYPIETEHFREMPDCGFGDRVTILLADIEDGYPHSSGWIGGYFYFYNYLPKEKFPDSNERHMIVIDTNPTIVDNPNNGIVKTLEEGLATIAHEYQNLFHF